MNDNISLTDLLKTLLEYKLNAKGATYNALYDERFTTMTYDSFVYSYCSTHFNFGHGGKEFDAEAVE